MSDPEFSLYAIPQHGVLAEQWHTRLTELNIRVDYRQVDQLNARFLRLNPQLCLLVDELGLWLAANGMKMQPAWHEETHRLKRASLKTEMIARACQIGKTVHILDATAGLGHDALLLASMGANVTMLERHPILFSLLQSALQQALQHPFLASIAQRISLIQADASEYLRTLSDEQFDVIYLDPMFPTRDANQKQEKKQAQVKKQMQLLHLLLPEDGVMDLGDQLLPLAQGKATRVVVKRPKHAVFLNHQQPQHQWQGEACRFDAYF
ncbi:rRNA methyltransferase [Acinetobacter qingfengensis]|uniref:Ribosomal RNA small subunit methyltransferase J n=1 Tax=Acinetobacter qingfengensis TaxID=1262585 RepID=A0A1E7RF46_9GAMM|nr:class I SAM-dependent methyltransferase [Acinetobacter qingfengensis]KAA8731858.1 rRNA methyltransferase [Acinetobacter qingfengensis]OEY98019.1 rRNA methyltransferase [Acinetobacter qingfengensis]